MLQLKGLHVYVSSRKMASMDEPNSSITDLIIAQIEFNRTMPTLIQPRLILHVARVTLILKSQLNYSPREHR